MMAGASKMNTHRTNGALHTAVGMFTLMLAVCLSGCALTTPSRSEVQRESVEPAVSDSSLLTAGTLTVALDMTDAPQAMSGTDGTPTGYYVDVARALAQRMGLKVALVSSSGPSKALGDKQADIFIGGTTRDADADIAITGSLLEDASAVFARTEDGQEPNASADQLNGATVAVQDASASQDALARAGITGAQKTFSNVNECFDALAKGEVQYVTCDATAGAYLARAYSDVSFAGIIGAASATGIAGPASGELADAIQTAYDAMNQDGTLDALHTAWYGGLPISLSDSVLSGVTISSTDTADQGQAAPAQGQAGTSTADGDNAVATDTPITGDINSLG